MPGLHHGRRWLLPDGQQPPDRIELDIDGQPSSYRLLRRTTGGRPVRDRSGNSIYLPVQPDSPRATETQPRQSARSTM